jgi:hypothetical protein
MRTSGYLSYASLAIRERVSIAVGALALTALLVYACAAGTPSAWASAHGPKYSLKIVEGETTLPEYEQIASTSGHVEPQALVAVAIVRSGLTVYRDVGEEGWAGFSQVPQVGDVVTLESPVGTLIASVVYDGLPSMDPTVCAGSQNFSGANSPGDTVEGFYVTKALKTNPYGQVIGVHQTSFGEAQVKTLSGTAFGGSFLKPLELGQTVGAVESLKTPLPGEATYTYTSENERPVGACPVPPPVYSPPPPPPLQGTIVKLLRATIHKLLKFGFSDVVGINQPGTVTQDLYAQGGTLPAFASSKRKHHAKPALLLARGTATAKAAGDVTVHLKLTKRGRGRLKTSSRVKATLVTTLRTSGGQRLSLGRRTVSLHR